MTYCSFNLSFDKVQERLETEQRDIISKHFDLRHYMTFSKFSFDHHNTFIWMNPPVHAPFMSHTPDYECIMPLETNISTLSWASLRGGAHLSAFDRE